MTKLQHQRIQHLQFLLRKAKRDLKAQPGKYNEIEVSWAKHRLDVAEAEAALTYVLPFIASSFTIQEFVHQ